MAGLTAAPMTQKANPVALTSYGQVPLGLEGSGASRRPGSIVRVLRTERWVRPTERAGSEGSFICCLRRQKNHTTALRASEMHSPFGGWRHHLALWEACHWIRGSRGSPMNPVPLPPPQFGGAAKGKRLNGQARRLTSPLWRSYAGPPQGHYKAPLCCELLMKGLLFRALFCPLNRGKSGAAGKGVASVASQSAECLS